MTATTQAAGATGAAAAFIEGPPPQKGGVFRVGPPPRGLHRRAVRLTEL